MKPKIRPIRDLYFRFIEKTELDQILNAQQAADALERAGLIEYIPHFSEPRIEHYRDTERLRVMLKNLELEPIVNILKQYATDHQFGDA